MLYSKLADFLVNISELTEQEIKNTFKENIIFNDWILLDEASYRQYHNLNITNFIGVEESKKSSLGDLFQMRDIRVGLETKDKYILLKYSMNFIAFCICDREYELNTHPLNLICVNRLFANNFSKRLDKLPKLSYILKVLGWKMSKKILSQIKQINENI